MIARKTPRIPRSYQVTAANFGKCGTYPPVTANAVFTRDVYDAETLDVTWAYGYEDYEWFWRVAKAGFTITFAPDINGAHHHRRSFRKLVTEYRRSANGCSHFIRAHGDSPLARKRRRQAFILPVAAAGGLALGGVMAAQGMVGAAASGVACILALLMAREITIAKRLDAAGYPFAGLALAAIFTWGLSTDLMRRDAAQYITATAPIWDGETTHEPLWRRAVRRTSWPLTAVLALQAGLSLSLVWSNTVFGDEATYIYQGQQDWHHWLHGQAPPVFRDSGSSLLYPPIGAIANAVGGLAAARILSLCFMLLATLFLYLTASRLFGRRAAIAAAGLWAVSEPVLRLAFATYDPLACLLIILAAWLAVQAGIRAKHAELIALASLTLALGAAVAYSFAIYFPAVVAIAFFAWQASLGSKVAMRCAGWLMGVSLALTAVAYSFLHSWPDVLNNTTHAGTALGAGLSSVVRAAWSWDDLIFAAAAVGVFAAFSVEATWSRKFLVLSLALSGVLVPAYQAHLGIGFSLDKHMSAGSGFMAVAAGYAFSRMRMPAWRPLVATLASAAFLAYPAITGIWYARSTFHLWQNVDPVVADLRPMLAEDPGPVSNPGMTLLGFYLLRQDPRRWQSFSAAGAKAGTYSIVILDLKAQFPSGSLPVSAIRNSPGLSSQILQLASAANVKGTLGNYAIVRALEQSHRYAIRYVIPFGLGDVAYPAGITIIWQRVR